MLIVNPVGNDRRSSSKLELQWFASQLLVILLSFDFIQTNCWISLRSVHMAHYNLRGKRLFYLININPTINVFKMHPNAFELCDSWTIITTEACMTIYSIARSHLQSPLPSFSDMSEWSQGSQWLNTQWKHSHTNHRQGLKTQQMCASTNQR